MPRAILFDLYNTLVPGGTDAERDAIGRAMGKDLGLDPAGFAELYHQVFPQRFVGALGDLEATVLAVAVRAGGVPTPAAVRLAAARRMALIRRLLWPSAATLATLAALRRSGWRLGLVSNCTTETPELWKRTPLAYHFDAVGFSCELGVAKPDPTIYLAVCSFLDVVPPDCVYVGDGADQELPAAANLGMSVVQTEEFVQAQETWPKQRIGAITDLIELVNDPLGRSPRSEASG